MNVWTAGFTPENKHNSFTTFHTIMGTLKCWEFCSDTILPIIIRIIPVVKVNEESVVDSSSNGCDTNERWVSSCQRLPASSLHGILTVWPTKYGREHMVVKDSMIFRTETNTENLWDIFYNCVHIKWHTVLRLLKRCLGASWPLQFFTYVFQLNSPSLQPVSKHTNITRTAYAIHLTVFFK